MHKLIIRVLKFFPKDDAFSRKVLWLLATHCSSCKYYISIYMLEDIVCMCKAQNMRFIVALHHLLNETFWHTNLNVPLLASKTSDLKIKGLTERMYSIYCILYLHFLGYWSWPELCKELWKLVTLKTRSRIRIGLIFV